MTSKEIRQSFLDFFKDKSHKIVQSAPVVPFSDPTLLFTNAGMNQFKDVFLGTGNREYSRAADTQKCIRVSGKHNDLEEVGVDTYHHTFFEMLGNWSFGDYYKKEAIDWAWELLTDVWKLDTSRLHATVYNTDHEAFELWTKYLPKDRIHYFGDKDNFWEMGETGPCGPCSEIHYDRTPDKSGGKLVNADSADVIEIWNLVFIQYNRNAKGELEPLKATHVDTGMGFERICAVIQGKYSNYDTDVFQPLISEIARLSEKEYSSDLFDKVGIAMRVMADHVRTLSFAIADGAIPGNEGRSYVLRRILRRGLRFARNLGFKEPVLYKLVDVLADTMGDAFPEIIAQKEMIMKVIKGEEESFLQTLENGIQRFEDIISRAGDSKIISGDDAFLLYDTFGFPHDLTELLARENNLAVDIEGFNQNMKMQKERSRAARKSHTQEVEIPDINEKSVFVGYTENEIESEVLFVKDDKIVLKETPFYTESGGQISDIGTILVNGAEYEVLEMKKSGDAIIHICDREVAANVGNKAFARINDARRLDIRRNHSATHLLHEALRTVLGEHVKQAGSLVAPDYLRFDFNHFEKVSDTQIKEIEAIVNKKILENNDVNIVEMPIDEAQKNPKIKMFFGDKYGEVVRVVSMDPKYSIELCGGTHVTNTSQIGLLKITSESSIAAGVRRIEAVTGRGVAEYMLNLEEKIIQKNEIEKELNYKLKGLEREIQNLRTEQLKKDMASTTTEATDVNGIKVVAQKVNAENVDQLRDIAENMRDEFASSAIILIAILIEDKVQLACAVTDDLKQKYPAGKLVGNAAKIVGGGGGGKPHLATAGGKDASKLDELLKEFPNIVKDFN